MHRGPQRGDAHQEIAVAADRDRQPPGALERQRRADRNAGAAADAAAAVGADIVERMAERPVRLPGQRQMRIGDRPLAERAAQSMRDRFVGKARRLLVGDMVARLGTAAALGSGRSP
jgi:hypothetical protein